MGRFAEALHSGRFLVTAELNPPKGTDVQDFLEKGDLLRDVVDALNVTDQHASIMAASPLALARLLLERGAEPILQVTCRDRNRIALQSDLLGAAVLGIENVLCLRGDPVSTGDNPDAKMVMELDAVGLLQCATTFMGGKDMGGSDLTGVPRFTLGAVIDPGAADPAQEVARMEQKIRAGATFFQTQAVFDPEGFARFMERARGHDVPILASIILLKSGRMARHMNDHIPGIHVPDALTDEVDEAQDRAAKAVEIAARTIRQVRPLCQGVHIIAVGWERRVPNVLEAAGLLERAQRV